MKIYHIAIICTSFLFISCGGGTNDSSSGQPPVADGGSKNYDYSVLMMGNSHTAPLPSLLDKIFTASQPASSVRIVNAPGSMYLIDRLNHQETLNLMVEDEWTHVVLQALKYSTSGTISYPTDGAEYFISESKSIGATPILFPEHPRRGLLLESLYLFQLHTSVASAHPACVAPVGFVWDDFLVNSELNLYAADGNHASQAGSFLTALVIYQTITQSNIIELPFIPSVGITQSQQELMKTTINEIVVGYPPCIYLNP